MSDKELRERIGGRSDLADLAPYRAPQLDVAIRLNTNESPYPPPDSFKEALATRIARSDLHRYPDREFAELREALGEAAGTITERVWAANGSNEILLQIMLAFGGSERKAMTFEPTYPMHSQITRISGTRLIRGRRNPDHTIHLEATLEAITSQAPDIVFLCSPNNPTGNAASEEEVTSICEAAPGIVILDEAYVEFAERPLLSLIEDCDRLIITRSFSKAWRLAGVRLGFLIAHPWVIEEIQKVRLPYHLSVLTQAAGLTAVEFADELRSTVETMKLERERLLREMSTMKGLGAHPSEANFVFFTSFDRPATEIWQHLLDAGILIRDFSDLPGCESSLRVSVGTPEQNEAFLETLSHAVVRS